MNDDDARQRERDGLRRAMAHAAEHLDDCERQLEAVASLVRHAPRLVAQAENQFASQVAAAMQKVRIGL